MFYVAKTKALRSYHAADLRIDFAYVKSRFSYDTAHM